MEPLDPISHSLGDGEGAMSGVDGDNGHRGLGISGDADPTGYREKRFGLVYSRQNREGTRDGVLNPSRNPHSPLVARLEIPTDSSSKEQNGA